MTRPLDDAGSGLDQLRDVLNQAMGVPMSASCMVNRAELLDLVHRIKAALPEELGRARGLLADSDTRAERIIAAARAEAARLTAEHEIVRKAQEMADRLRAETEQECAELRRETDLFIDSRMASFESVLHKTTSQVATARQRLTERSTLDDPERT